MLEILAQSAQLLIALAGAYVVALWFVLVVWTFRDIESRSRNVVTQVVSTLMVVLFFVPGVLLYLILRPKETLDGTFQRSLEEEYLLQDLEELPLCPGCRRYVEDDFVLCPNCHVQLREPCHSCSRLVDLRWALCPYCAAAQHGKTAIETERAEAPAARWTAPSARTSGRAITPAAQAGAAAATETVLTRTTVVPADGTAPAPAEPPFPSSVPDDGVAAEPQPAPLTLFAGAKNVVRPTDRFRTRRATPPVNPRPVPLAPTDGVASAAPADGVELRSELTNGRGRSLASSDGVVTPSTDGNGHGGNGRGDGRKPTVDPELEHLEPLTLVPADPAGSAEESGKRDLVLAKPPVDRD